MAYQGLEAQRGCLKHRCPAAAHAVQCTQRDLCNQGRLSAHGRVVRVPLDRDRRLFTPPARDSKAWRREYNKRTSVERVNSRQSTIRAILPQTKPETSDPRSGRWAEPALFRKCLLYLAFSCLALVSTNPQNGRWTSQTPGKLLG